MFSDDLPARTAKWGAAGACKLYISDGLTYDRVASVHIAAWVKSRASMAKMIAQQQGRTGAITYKEGWKLQFLEHKQAWWRSAKYGGQPHRKPLRGAASRQRSRQPIQGGLLVLLFLVDGEFPHMSGSIPHPPSPP